MIIFRDVFFFFLPRWLASLNRIFCWFKAREPLIRGWKICDMKKLNLVESSNLCERIMGIMGKHVLETSCKDTWGTYLKMIDPTKKSIGILVGENLWPRTAIDLSCRQNHMYLFAMGALPSLCQNSDARFVRTAGCNGTYQRLVSFHQPIWKIYIRLPQIGSWTPRDLWVKFCLLRPSHFAIFHWTRLKKHHPLNPPFGHK